MISINQTNDLEQSPVLFLTAGHYLDGDFSSCQERLSPCVSAVGVWGETRRDLIS